MGCNHSWGNQKHRLIGFFFTQKIGEYGYGFSFDEEEEINGDSLTIYGSTVIADAADFIRAFNQYTLDDYLYKLSCAQIQFMAVDNTHTKYLKGSDKRAWERYKAELEAQQKTMDFLNGFKLGESGVLEVTANRKQGNVKNKK